MTDDRTFAPREDDDANTPDEALERLAKADPAATVEVSESFVTGVVARAAADPAKEAAPAAPTAASTTNSEINASDVSEPDVQATTPTTDDDGETPAVLDLTAARDRRRPRWHQVASAAAVAGLVGVGGYAIGAQNDTVLLAEGDAAAPISLNSGTSGGGAESASSPDIAVAPQSTSYDSRSMIYPGSFGHRTFSSSGLSSTARSALGYSFDTSSVTTETVNTLAAALGVSGSAELRDGTWFVGAQDGTAPNVGVSLDGSMNFYFSNPTINPWECGVIEPAPAVDSGTGEGSEGGEDAATSDIAIDPVEPCTPSTPAPSEEAAIEALRNLLVSIGRDPATYEFTSETWEGSSTRSAQAWLVAEGQRTDHAISVEVAEAGIFSAYGPLATLVSLGEYPVVSEQEAFERLSDSRFGANQTYWPMDLARTDTGTTWTPPTAPPTTPSAGTPVAWPVTNVDITGARLGLASQWQVDGTVLVVPAYEFTASDGGTWSVIAVAEESLDFSTE